MVHPITVKTIVSYKQLMNYPATAEVWQTAFGQIWGGIVQGNNKTGSKVTNVMFVIKRDETAHVLVAGKIFTYANPVVDFCPQKDDSYMIQITAGRNLIIYEGDASVSTANLITANIHWSSVMSTKDASYMCLNKKTFISPQNLNTSSI